MRYSKLVLSLSFCLLTSWVPTSAQPVLDIDRSFGPARIEIDGEGGHDYTLEGSSTLAADSWEFLITTPLTNGPQSWFDADSVLSPKRFYRAFQREPATLIPADGFRLIDHHGKSRWLDYYLEDTNLQAMVLIFTGNGCSNVQHLVTSIKGLTNQFRPPAVRIWMINANAADNRSNILAEAVALGLSNGPPVLDDRAQLVARTYGATKTPEAVALHKVFSEDQLKDVWSIFYRGAIDDRLGPNPSATTQTYLSNALTAFLAGASVAPSETRAKGCDITLNATPAASYSSDIAPLLLDKCVRCHSPGNIAPFALTNFNTALGYSPLIREEVLAGRMPPWHADPEYGVFTNDSSLSPQQAAMLVAWIDDGSPRGGGPDPLATANPSLDFPFIWPVGLGQPDVILTLPAQSIKATGVEAYRTLSAINPLTTNAWVRAAAILPGTVPVVHHVLAYFGTDNLVNSFFTGYVPGTYPTTFPPGTGKLLPAGQVISFQMHYTPVGVQTNDTTRLGLYLMPSAPTFPLVQSSAPDGFFTIPTNADESTYERVATVTPSASKSINLYEFSPHMHLRGARFKYEAIYLGGAREVLLNVPFYEFHWQTAYRFTQPKVLPPGTQIRCTGAWDNTYLNHELMEAYEDSGDNRYLPNRTVSWGDQSYDEMFIGYFNYSVNP